MLESVIDITKNTDGQVESVPGKGFNFFRLFFEFKNEPQKVELDIDNYLSELYIFKSIIFNSEETKFYKELFDICKNVDLDHDTLGSASMAMLNRCLELYPDDNERTEDSFLNSEKPSESNSSERI